MKRNIKFAVNDIQKIHLEDYAEDEFSIARMGFLSTRPNSHELNISEDVLRQSAPSVLGKWVVADMTAIIDAGTHTDNQTIVGRVPENQTVEFVKDDDGYLRAYVDTIISKVYARDYCAMFEGDNDRAVSVEMTVETSEEDENEVLSFRIVGVTTLGHAIRPSCPQSNITFTRFSEEDANAFFNKVHKNSLTALEQFAESRKKLMAESKSYKIDKSKEAMSDKAWGDVDKTELRNKIMEAKNRSTLVKAVYMLIEDGWEESPSEHLKYPVMCFEGDTLVYNKGGLSSALGYAKKENETTVVNKINKIYKNLGLDQDGKEEDAKMAEIEFAAVDIGDMWGKVWDALHAKYPDGDWGSVYRIDGIYEEDNKKFAIIRHKDEDTKYRLDFSLTEEGLTLSDEIIKVELEIIETDDVKKFAEPENAAKFKKFEDDDSDDEDDEDEDKDDDDKSVEMSADEMKDKMTQMQKDIEEKENIIMEKDRELEELREFKRGVEEKEKMMSVEAILSEVNEFMSEDSIKSLREEGKALSKDQIDAFANKVKAQAFEFSANTKKNKKTDVWSFAAPNNFKENKSKSVWDRI